MHTDIPTTREHDLRDRVDELLASLADIGRDPATGGYRRFAWTDTDRLCRAWFADQAQRRGMTVEVDHNGNQWAWLGQPGPGSVAMGSHLDSVPDGGAFDGPLGVISAFLAIDVLRARGTLLTRPLAVANFADEEGARFGLACVGSRLTAGMLEPEQARNLRDASGTTLREAMAAAGHDPSGLGPDNQRLARIAAFLELHIEQGRGLVELGAPVGLATSIWPHGRWRFDFTGEPDHAGTTRLADRQDPMIPLAHTILAARDAAASHAGVATVGKTVTRPNGVNAIPAMTSGWLDCRAPSRDALERIVADVTEAATAAAQLENVAMRVTPESLTAPTEFDTKLRATAQRALGDVPELETGAGHDAGILAAVIPTAMVFVRNNTGVSHSPKEHATTDDCKAGVLALARVVEYLQRHDFDHHDQGAR